jgi:4-amino-4-deoxy-L-arabinose transferase-like glycosyltransferase
MSSRRKRSKQHRTALESPPAAGAGSAKRSRTKEPKTVKLKSNVRVARPTPRFGLPRRALRPQPARPPASLLEAPFDRVAVGIAAGVGLIALVLYLLTVEPSVPTGDSGELIAGAYVLGVPHPPGYPLYMLLGHIASWFPGGSPALRMNVLSALLDAAAVAVVFLTIYRLVGRSVAQRETLRERAPSLAAAAVGALLLAFSTLFWSYSVVAEVFALNNLFAAVLLLLATEWCRRPDRIRLLWAFAFCFGLALTNQQTIVLFVPAFLVLAWAGGTALRRARELEWRKLVPAVGLFIAGLLPVVYLPIAAAANPVVNWGDPTSVGRLVGDLRRKSYGTLSLTGTGHATVGEQWKLLATDLAHDFVFVGLAFAALGLWWTWRHRRAEGIALLVAFVVAGPLFVAYANPGYPNELTKGVVARFYILPSIPVAILAGLGASWLLLHTELLRPRTLRAGLATAIAVVALLAAPVAAAVVHYSDADRSSDDVALHYAQDVLQPLAPNALLLMRGDENFTSLFYAQFVDHLRPDVVALDTEMLKLPTYVEQKRREHPNLVIPFRSYDGGGDTSLNDLVRANLHRRPVYYVGAQEEKDFGKPFDSLIAGLATQLVSKGSAPDREARLLRDPGLVENLHFPLGSYPDTSWEAAIAEDYSAPAFDLAYALQRSGGTAGARAAERLFRIVIRLDPTQAAAYKNLGLLLHDNGGDPKEIVAVWGRYLQLNPTDPQADSIRSVLASLEAGPAK